MIINNINNQNKFNEKDFIHYSDALHRWLDVVTGECDLSG